MCADHNLRGRHDENKNALFEYETKNKKQKNRIKKN